MKLLSALVCALAALLFVAPARAADPPLDLESLTVAGAQTQMAAGQLTAVQLTRAYINRIAAVNSRGVGLNAVRMLNPRALQDAAQLDLERATGHVRGPLHGIPVLVNDNLDASGLPTTAGNVALQNSIPDRDSAVVAKLRAAGAVVLGKTNLTEFANFMSTGNAMPPGYSSLGGQVLNPYDVDASPNGASSGSGAAAAAGLAMVTVGTETSSTTGSIVNPAVAQGGVGLRPTVGLVSRSGMLPLASTQDTPGPITRTVADAAAELQAIAGKDPEDPATDSAPAVVPDYLSGLTATALQGKRIGVISSTNAQYVAAVAAIQALGATTVTVASPTAPNAPDILTPEFKRDLNAYLGRLPASAPMKSLQDIIDYDTAHGDEALKFGQQQLLNSQASDLTDPAKQAQYLLDRDASRNPARAAIDATLTTNTLDALMTPSATLTALGDRAGYPQIVVPAGYNASNRIPVGIAFNGTAYSEQKLLAFAYAYEQATKLRQPASFVNPAVWRCTPGSAFGPRSCGPTRDLLNTLGTVKDLGFSLETATVADLKARMAAGTLTAVDLTRNYLARIARTNLEGPSLDAVRALNPKALQEAAAADAARAAGDTRPLLGIPVIVKDNLDAAGIPTTAGSVALENSVPDRDSTVVANLRRAGAILLGKANLSEFANFLTSGMPSGYSSLGGQVLNPYDADITPSGSSSGSGAIAATGLAAITIGTETSGSITSPSAAQGIVGLRPTIGLVSRTGIVPISATQDTAGPMTRTVADAAAELSAIAGKDPEDPATATAPATVPDYVAGLSATALQGKRIGIVASNNAQFVAAVAAVQALGATTVTVTVPNTTAPDILTPEFKRDMNAYLARLPASAPMKTLHDIRVYNDAPAHTQEAVKYGQSQVVASDNTDLTNPAQLAAYNTNRANSVNNARTALDNVLTTNNLDAIMSAATTLTAIGARAGYPQLVIPAGYSGTTRDPVGIAFQGTAYSEAKLLAFGYAYEQATKLRKPPSEINPSMWRCVPGNAYVVARTACAPGETANADVVATTVGGTVPATLALTLGAPASFGAFTPGLDHTYTASTTANVISTAGDATLSVSDPGRLANGSFSLPETLKVTMTPSTWSAPVSNGAVAIGFSQHIGSNDALRTGSYSKTLTFTLSTTTP